MPILVGPETQGLFFLNKRTSVNMSIVSPLISNGYRTFITKQKGSPFPGPLHQKKNETYRNKGLPT